MLVHELEPTSEAAVARLSAEGERLFGHRGVRFTILDASEREASRVLKVAVAGVGNVDAVFVKVFKPRESGRQGIESMRARVLRDFEVTSRLYKSMSSFPHFAVVRPLACFPDELAIVTEQASGATLSELLERRATWWPSQKALEDLGGLLSRVGGWLRAFHTIEARNGSSFSLDDMRAYIDVRLGRLLATDPPALGTDGRERVLRYVDRTATLVDSSDLQEVLTHGDLAPSNILINGQDVTVIDFAMATPGSMFMDVARLFTQLEFLTAKPKFRPAVVRELQRRLLHGFDPALRPDRPLFRLFLLQHLLCHMSNLARNPAPPLSRLYNRHQLRLRQRWLQTFAA